MVIQNKLGNLSGFSTPSEAFDHDCWFSLKQIKYFILVGIYSKSISVFLSEIKFFVGLHLLSQMLSAICFKHVRSQDCGTTFKHAHARSFDSDTAKVISHLILHIKTHMKSDIKKKDT